ncbi:MAG: hypothetical protein JWO59_2499 [Chloroflexi bacterium]|nr:hypothetical protein [Chloroflexota bacterium]
MTVKSNRDLDNRRTLTQIAVDGDRPDCTGTRAHWAQLADGTNHRSSQGEPVKD